MSRPSPLRSRPALAGIAVLVGLGSLWAWSAGGGGGASGPVPRRIDTVASVRTINLDPGWEISNGATTAAARFGLDDGRILTVLAGTLADQAPIVPACSDYVTAGGCVLLADMLGDAVVWFALVAADDSDGDRVLTLPGIVDMEDGGNLGVYANGWILPLASPTRRECDSRDTTNLRQFITIFPPDRATSTLDLIADTVTSVACLEG